MNRLGWLVLIGVLAGCAADSPPTGWLPSSDLDRDRQIEKHFRGLDVAMAEVGYRYGELYFAGLEGNWDYAAYQIDKIELAVQLGIERRPKRAASARPFLKEEIPAMKEAIGRRETTAFKQEFERFRAACMKCHVSEQVPFFTVQIPDRRISPIGK